MQRDLGLAKRVECDERDGDWACTVRGEDGNETVIVDRFKFEDATEVSNMSNVHDITATLPGECRYTSGHTGGVLTCSD